MMILAKQILFFDKECVLSCDGNCKKAWGINHRPRLQLSETDDDDIVYLADGELDDAPDDPGTYEGGHAKPRNAHEQLNKWCARECERSAIFDVGKPIDITKMPDFSKRLYNIPRETE